MRRPRRATLCYIVSPPGSPAALYRVIRARVHWTAGTWTATPERLIATVTGARRDTGRARLIARMFATPAAPALQAPPRRKDRAA